MLFKLGMTGLCFQYSNNINKSMHVQKILSTGNNMKSLRLSVKQLDEHSQGASDMPAWVVAKANQYARDHALTPFVIYQGLWNVMDRSFEREILLMA
jgi:aryl-alcohol dehydrogenase-like predicted oxidoreductase